MKWCRSSVRFLISSVLNQISSSNSQNCIWILWFFRICRKFFEFIWFWSNSLFWSKFGWNCYCKSVFRNLLQFLCKFQLFWIKIHSNQCFKVVFVEKPLKLDIYCWYSWYRVCFFTYRFDILFISKELIHISSLYILYIVSIYSWYRISHFLYQVDI